MIVLRAKQVEFDVTYVNLRDKPDWFLALSPHGKVPVLKVDERRLFESNAICEYLDEVIEPRLHPADPFERAVHRAWTDFVPTFAAGLSVYYAKTREDVEARLDTARQYLGRLEQAIAEQPRGDGPFFGGAGLCLVDAAYAPFLTRFLYVDRWLQSDLLDEFAQVAAWARALAADERVAGSVPDNFTDEFHKALRLRAPYVASLMDASVAAG